MTEIKKPLIQQGWLRALLYLLVSSAAAFIMLFIITLVQNTNFEKLLSTQPNNINEFIITYSLNSLPFILTAFLLRIFIDKQSFYSLGFKWKGFSSNAFSGLFVGIIILSVGSLLLMASKCIYFIGINLNITHLLYSAALFLIVAFVEEVMFRGYLLNNLMQSMHKFAALAVSALVFAIFHIANPDATILSIANIFIAGLLLGVNYIYTKNLWFGIFLHFAWNYFQGPVLGYEVSGFTTNGIFQQTLNGPALFTGGNFGFEGSIVCPVLEILATALLIKKYEKQQQKLTIN